MSGTPHARDSAGLVRRVWRALYGRWDRTRRSVRRTAFRLRSRRGFGVDGRAPSFRDSVGTPLVASDISDHLPALWFAVVATRASLVVELGTRAGESTRALLAGCADTGGQLLSIDLEDCSNVRVPHSDRWTFVQSDDLSFGRERFTGWCSERGLPARADVVFIDSSHWFEHTLEELRVWAPHVAPTGAIILHDSAFDGPYHRLDGSVGLAGHTERGVTRALETFLGTEIAEDTHFSDLRGGWSVLHLPWCNGLTILTRAPGAGES